jgi:hypothetical protein
LPPSILVQRPEAAGHTFTPPAPPWCCTPAIPTFPPCT